jgi:hypothetical protein
MVPPVTPFDNENKGLFVPATIKAGIEPKETYFIAQPVFGTRYSTSHPLNRVGDIAV